MKSDNNDLVLEIRKALILMYKNIGMSKISFREFLTCYKLLMKYIELGEKDYFPFANSLLGACVIFKNRNDIELFNNCVVGLHNIINKKVKKK